MRKLKELTDEELTIPDSLHKELAQWILDQDSFCFDNEKDEIQKMLDQLLE